MIKNQQKRRFFGVLREENDEMSGIFRFFRTFSHQEVLHVNFSQNISVNTNMKIYQNLKVLVTFQPLCLSESTP